MDTNLATDTTTATLPIAVTGAGRRAATLADRLQSWAAGYEIRDEQDRWAFEQLVVSSLRVDDCRARESALRAYESARAELAWDDDRRLEAEELGATLARRPAVVARKLGATVEGCRWLLRRWEALARVEEWTEEHEARAFDLLGVAAELRHGAPWASHGSPAALAESERSRLEARLSGPLAALEALERSMAESGMPLRESAEMRRLRRDEAMSLRRYEEARRRLMPRVAPEPPADVRPSGPAPVPGPVATPTPPPSKEMEPPFLPVSATPPREPVGFVDVAATGPRPNRRARRAAMKRARAGRS